MRRSVKVVLGIALPLSALAPAPHASAQVVWPAADALPGYAASGGAAVLPAWPAPAWVAPQQGPVRKSPLLAGLLQAAFPPLPLGYAYAGDLGRGLVPSVLMVAGTTLFLVEAIEAIDWTNDEGGSDALIQAGLLMAGAGYLWGIVGAVDTAQDHNARIAAPSLALVPGGWGVTLAVIVPVGRTGGGARSGQMGAR